MRMGCCTLLLTNARSQNMRRAHARVCDHDAVHPAPDSAPSPDSPSAIGAGTFAWALYDFGFSLFAFVVFARYLSDWLIIDLGFPDYYYTITQAVTACTLLILMPAAGTLAARWGRHVPLLATFTALSAGACAGLGFLTPGTGLGGILPTLALGGICAGMAGLALAQFDPLLARVAPAHQWGTVSGYAVAAGFIGFLAGNGIFSTVIVGEGNKQQAFVPAAIILAVCTVPLIALVRERPTSRSAGTKAWRDAVEACKNSLGLIGEVARTPRVGRLLAGRFLYTDAVGTVNIYLVVYISRMGGFSDANKSIALGIGVVCAAAGALVSGAMAQQFGPRRTLMVILPGFAAALVATALLPYPWTIWMLAPVIGISLGTVYTCDRVFMLALTPSERRGEFFGVFNLIGRVAQAAGPLVFWGGTIWILHNATGWMTAFDANRVALALLGACTLAGLAVIRPLDDGHRAKD